MGETEPRRGRKPRATPKVYKKVTMNMPPDEFEHQMGRAEDRDLTLTALITGAVALSVDVNNRLDEGYDLIARDPQTGRELDMTAVALGPKRYLNRVLDRALGEGPQPPTPTPEA